MLFKRQDFLIAVQQLSMALVRNADFVLYPKELKLYGFEDINTVRGESWAELYANRYQLNYVSLEPFLERMVRDLDLRNLPPLVDTGYAHGDRFEERLYQRKMRFERQTFIATVDHLREANKAGFDHLAYLRTDQLLGFDDVIAIRGQKEASEFAEANLAWRVLPLGPCLKALVAVLQNENLPDIVSAGYHHNQLNNSYMNLKNLENLKEEMKKLGFAEPLIEQMEEHMKANEPAFKLLDRVDAAKGVVDLTLHFKQSGQSDFYYLNRLEALNNQGKVLENGEKYAVLVKDTEGKISAATPFDTFAEAVEMFRKKDGDFALGVIKDKEVVAELATMVAGKVTHIDNAIKRDYFAPPLSQTFWLDHGKGFNREQAANLVQGRAVYRDDLLSREGKPYQAWMQLDTDKVRDNHNNLGYRQFTDAYGYDIKAQLEEYKIAEMEDPKKAAQLEQVLKNGGRPLITVEKDGKPMKLYLETSVRFGKLNFYSENGRPEKREQFLKQTGFDKTEQLESGKAKAKGKVEEQAQGMGV